MGKRGGCIRVIVSPLLPSLFSSRPLIVPDLTVRVTPAEPVTPFRARKLLRIALPHLESGFAYIVLRSQPGS